MSIQVVMKLDIEGSEHEVIPDLLLSGAFKNIDKTFIEWHWDRTTEEVSEENMAWQHDIRN